VTDESTTPDLVELNRRIVEAWNRRDIEAAISFYAPNAVFEMRGTVGVLEGRAAIGRFLEDWLGAYDEFEQEVEERRDLGSGVTFGVAVQRGRPRGSTGWAQVQYGVVSTWVDGLIQWTRFYKDPDEARAAAERLAEERGYEIPEEPTTPDLEELAQRWFDAVNRRDFDAALRVYAPDCVIEQEMGTLEGVPAIRALLEEWLGFYEEIEFESEEVLDLGNGVGFAVIRMHGRPVDSSGYVQMRFASVFARREGLMVWARHYSEADIEKARADAERLAEKRG
jgi:ketosteroid isomerase-like protein